MTVRAAAPRTVTVLDALPVTAIGKPYKVPSRAEAARQVFTEALAGHVRVTLDVHIDNGTRILTVTLADSGQRGDVDRSLSHYAVAYPDQHCGLNAKWGKAQSTDKSGQRCSPRTARGH